MLFDSFTYLHIISPIHVNRINFDMEVLYMNQNPSINESLCCLRAHDCVIIMYLNLKTETSTL